MIEIRKITTRWDSVDHTTIVAEKDGRIVGTCIVDYDKCDGELNGDAYLWNLWVLPSMRKHRVADELVRQAEQDATGKECRIISLEWSPIDTDGWALDWYKRIGFNVKKGCARIGCVRLSKELKK